MTESNETILHATSLTDCFKAAFAGCPEPALDDELFMI
jgi:hypothetical protein